MLLNTMTLPAQPALLNTMQPLMHTAYVPEAQFFLAESLLNLAQQRRMEERVSTADSLRELALQVSHPIKSGGFLGPARPNAPD